MYRDICDGIYYVRTSGRLIHGFPGVLTAAISSHWDTQLQCEFHVARRSPATIPSQGQNSVVTDKAEVIHVILRMPLGSRVDKYVLGGVIGMSVIDAHLSQLPHLRTFVVETMDNTARNALLVQQLDRLRTGDRVRQRTCSEAEKLASEAKANRGNPKDEAISPLWYNPKLASERAVW